MWTVVAVVANTKFGKTKLEDVSKKIKTLKWGAWTAMAVFGRFKSAVRSRNKLNRKGGG